MTDTALAAMSNTLFHVAFGLYLAAMIAYFFRLAFTRVSAEGVQASTTAGRRIGHVGLGLVAVGFTVHLVSFLSRGVVAGRVPWGNMYEYGSGIALLAIGGALFLVQRRYGHLMGFVIAGALLMMTTSLLLFTEAGPLVPALESYWLQIHTSAMMFSSSVFIIAFVATALYLVKDHAERKVAHSSTFGGSTVGAAEVRILDGEVEGRVIGDDVDSAEAPASPTAQRDVLNPLLFPVIPFVVVLTFVLLVWRAPFAAMLAASAFALIGAGVWYAIPSLPPAAKLDNLAYRTTAFAFPLFTFGVMCGAIWAEEAWGRYWGWDPKETGSFVTWTLYAAYLHARSTRGWRGPGAAWVGVIAFTALMITYYAVNLFIVGLHSYAGV
ncbi:MAG TPA: c-type cytochrome biogenesis protein CcsB [Euzebya sp.]|nr:c-type cytochrome biogenesis protein CcsB [Euzebya sp.]